MAVAPNSTKIEEDPQLVEPQVKNKMFFSDSNAVEVRTTANMGLGPDTLKSYFKGPESGGGREKNLLRTKEAKPGVYQVWFEIEEDAAAVIAKESHFLMGEKLEVISLERRDYCTVLVSNITEDEFKNFDRLESYFRSTKYGAGSDFVECVQSKSDGTEARIIIKDIIVATFLVANSIHFKLGPDVQFTITSPPPDEHLQQSSTDTAAQQSSTGTDKPPLVLPLDSLTIEHLKEFPEVLESFCEEMKMFVSVDTDKGTAVLQLNESSPQDCIESSVVKQFLSMLSSKHCNLDFDIPSDAVKDMHALISQHCTKEHLSYKLYHDQVSVVGLIKPVTDLVQLIERVCGQPVLVTDECRLCPEDYAFFTGVKREEIEKQCHGVRVCLNGADECLSVIGPWERVMEFKRQLPMFVDHVNVPVDMTVGMVRYLRARYKMRVKASIRNSNIIPFYTDHLKLSLLCGHEDIQLAEEAATNIKHMILL